MRAPAAGPVHVVRASMMLILAALPAACRTEPEPGEIEWIRTHAIPLATCEAGHGFQDLEPIGALVGDAHIVALGECTHGTREVFQMKHRLIEYLASAKGFTIFSIEANMPEAYRLNEYVLFGKGDPKQLIAGMYFWTWNTEEVLAMVEWMRQFNQSGKGHLEFTGFDMQTPDVAMDVVLDFLGNADPQRVQRVTDTYRNLRDGRFRKGPVPRGNSADVAAGTDRGPEPAVSAKACGEIVAELQTNRVRYAQATSQQAADWAIQNARVVHQCMQLEAREISRDESMAINVKWIRDQAPGAAKIILWAHNGHVGRRSRFGGAMGAFLDTWYGDDQVVFGFAAGEGVYTARGRRRELKSDHPLQPPVNGSYEEYFRASAVPRFILDLRSARTDDPASRWLTRPHAFRSIGALAMDGQFHSEDIRGQYDAIIYLDQTTASRLLPGAGERPGAVTKD